MAVPLGKRDVQWGNQMDAGDAEEERAGRIPNQIEYIAGRNTSVSTVPASVPPRLPAPGRRIAIARDAAFSFVYPHVEAGWRAAGAVLVPFSPLADEPPPEDCDACWLPGGYPELHAGRLAGAVPGR